MTNIRETISFVACAAVGIIPQSAFGQGQAMIDLLDAGVRDCNAGQYDAGIAKIRSVMEASNQAIMARVELAKCLEEKGDLLEAIAVNEKIAIDAPAVAAESGNASRIAQAREIAEAARRNVMRLQEKLPRLQVAVDESIVDRSAIEISIGNRPSVAYEMGKPIFMNPGKQIATLRIAEDKYPAATIDATTAGSTFLLVPLPRLRVMPSSTKWTVAGFIAGGLGATAVVAGSYFGIDAKMKMRKSEAYSHCQSQSTDGSKDICDQYGWSVREDAMISANLSTILFATGAVISGASAVMLLALGRSKSGRIKKNVFLVITFKGIELVGQF